MTAKDIVEAVKLAREKTHNSPVIYIHDGAGEAFAAIVDIDIFNREDLESGEGWAHSHIEGDEF